MNMGNELCIYIGKLTYLIILSNLIREANPNVLKILFGLPSIKKL